MIDFLVEVVRPILIYSQILIAVFGIYSVSHDTQLLVKLFSKFYLISAIVQLVGYLLAKNSIIATNYILYNILFLITFVFLFFLYCSYINKSFLKAVFIALVGSYLGLICVEVFYLKINYLHQTQVIPYIFAGTSIVVLILVFFYFILKSNEIIYIHQKMIFWVSVAYFLYYLCFVPLKIDQHYFSLLEESRNLVIVSRVIASLIFNILITIGFIWQIKMKLKP